MMSAETEALINFIDGRLMFIMRAHSGQDGWERKDLLMSAWQMVVSMRRIRVDGLDHFF